MINLTNYEEYFLLYIDKELNKEECAALEAFVREHPHLAAELEMWQDTKLSAGDAVLFDGKSSLLKSTNSSINIHNYEEYFLRYTDKELLPAQHAAVEQFVLQHPQLQEEFLLLQRTILTPEAILFPDKARLYKQPAKRVIPLYITRIAVAAAVLGVVAITGSKLMNKGNHLQVAVNTPAHKPVVSEQNILPQNNIHPVLPKEKDTNTAVAVNEPKTVKKEAVKTNKTASNTTPVLLNDAESKHEPMVAQIKPIEVKLPTPQPEEISNANNNTMAKQNGTAALKLLEEVNEPADASTVVYVSDEMAMAQPAVYKELNTEEDDQTLYVGSLQLNKARVNGLFKKAAHLLGSKPRE